MKLMKKITAALLAVCLALCVSACGEDTAWAYETEGTQLPAGLYIHFLISSLQDAETQVIEEQTAANPDFSVQDDLTPKKLLKMELEGKTVADWSMEQAQNRIRQYCAAEKRFAELDMSISEEEMESIQYTVETSWADYGDFYERNGVLKSSVTLYMINELKKQKLFEHVYIDEDYPVDEEEVKAQFAELYAKASLMITSRATEPVPSGLDTLKGTAELDEELRAKLEAYGKRIQAGEAFEDIVYEFELELALKNGDDSATVTKPEPGSLDLIVGKDGTNEYAEYLYAPEFVDMVFGAEIGQPIIEEDSYYMYLINRGDVLEDPTDLEAFRLPVLFSIKGDEFDAMLLDWSESIPLQPNQKAIDRYKPGNIKFE